MGLGPGDPSQHGNAPFSCLGKPWPPRSPQQQGCTVPALEKIPGWACGVSALFTAQSVNVSSFTGSSGILPSQRYLGGWREMPTRVFLETMHGKALEIQLPCWEDELFNIRAEMVIDINCYNCCNFLGRLKAGQAPCLSHT